MDTSTRKLLLWLTLFAVAFGYIEASVVVYLRAVHYPDGFSFPLLTPPASILWTEIVREAATLLLLLSVAFLAARNNPRRFAVFAYCFGIWDLVYYLSLKIVLDWPASLLDWDVLFLIPLPWISPVLAPMLVSMALIAAAVLILRLPTDLTAFRPVDWLVETIAGLVIIGSFLWNVSAIAEERAPEYFPWWLFAVGLGLGVAWFAWRYAESIRDQSTP